MPVSPEHLPAELHYLIPLADRHGEEGGIVHFDRRLGRHVKYAETLSAADLEPLRALYTEIRTRGHDPVINGWYHRNKAPAETTWPVKGLLVLFDHLADLELAPFTDRAVGFREKPAEPLDWSKLPPPLRYVAGPAEVYGGLQFENRIREFLRERMTEEERAELRELSWRFEQDGDVIHGWIDELGLTRSREAALVYFTDLLLQTGVDLGLWE